jgi:hypothetical protein
MSFTVKFLLTSLSSLVMSWCFFMCADRLSLLHTNNILYRTTMGSHTVTLFCFRFFHESSSPKPLKITLGSFCIFLENRGDIRKSRCNTGINDTCGKFCHRYRWCRWYRWQIIGTKSDCLHLKVNLEKIENNKNFSDWRFFPFATFAPWAANISANFQKNLKRPNVRLSTHEIAGL